MAQSRPSKAGLRPQDGCDTQGQVESLCVAVGGAWAVELCLRGTHMRVVGCVVSRRPSTEMCARESVRL